MSCKPPSLADNDLVWEQHVTAVQHGPLAVDLQSAAAGTGLATAWPALATAWPAYDLSIPATCFCRGC